MTLAQEAQRYLAVIEVFRAEGCEPHWRREIRAEASDPHVSPLRPIPNAPKRRN